MNLVFDVDKIEGWCNEILRAGITSLYTGVPAKVVQVCCGGWRKDLTEDV